MFCGFCGSSKHTRNTCPRLAERQGVPRMFCWWCGKYDHSTTHCPRKFYNIKERELERARNNGKFDGIDLED